MDVSRRDFLKVSGMSTGLVLTGLFSLRSVKARAQTFRSRIRYAKQVSTICPYCAVGCSEIVSVRNGEVINIEGDPDHPINEGSLCSKGGALYQICLLYTAPSPRDRS